MKWYILKSGSLSLQQWIHKVDSNNFFKSWCSPIFGTRNDDNLEVLFFKTRFYSFRNNFLGVRFSCLICEASFHEINDVWIRSHDEYYVHWHAVSWHDDTQRVWKKHGHRERNEEMRRRVILSVHWNWISSVFLISGSMERIYLFY